MPNTSIATIEGCQNICIFTLFSAFATQLGNQSTLEYNNSHNTRNH